VTLGKEGGVKRTFTMQIQATASSLNQVVALRDRYREEMNCQIVHDSIHRRDGWTLTYLLSMGPSAVGYGSVAIAGPWKEKPTIFEFYVLPECRTRAFDLFEAFLDASGARFMEIQSSDPLLSVMLHTYARNIWAEKIVFHDKHLTSLVSNGAVLHSMTSDEETRMCIEQRQGGTEWRLDVDGATAATGGIMFHYNQPYGDIYMEVAEPFRRRGVGSYLVQELKRVAYELGSIPCARCSPENVASRKTLQKAGFVPHASILNGSI
jgi:RimJ/RimL family protein N-acetyltransferase